MARKRLSFAERRSRILGAAARVFAEHGYAEAAMDRIALAAGVTKPVLYDHFESKEALFVTVLESVRDKLVAEGEKASASSASDDNRVRAAVRGFLDVAEAAPDAMRVLVSARYGDPAGAKLARMVQSSAVAGIAAMLAPTSADGEPWTRLAAAQFVMSGLHATALWWFENEGVSKDALAEVAATIVWRGISAWKANPERLTSVGLSPLEDGALSETSSPKLTRT
jgi:AcrR family transcriptional regulator